jgi:hypothetical protein
MLNLEPWPNFSEMTECEVVWKDVSGIVGVIYSWKCLEVLVVKVRGKVSMSILI